MSICPVQLKNFSLMTKPMTGPNSPSGSMTSLKYFTTGPSRLQSRLLVNVMYSTWQGATVVRGSHNDSTRRCDTSKTANANNGQIDVPVLQKLQKHITASPKCRLLSLPVL